MSIFPLALLKTFKLNAQLCKETFLHQSDTWDHALFTGSKPKCEPSVKSLKRFNTPSMHANAKRKQHASDIFF